jgi:hypothetical protein
LINVVACFGNTHLSDIALDKTAVSDDDTREERRGFSRGQTRHATPDGKIPDRGASGYRGDVVPCVIDPAGLEDGPDALAALDGAPAPSGGARREAINPVLLEAGNGFGRPAGFEMIEVTPDN